MKTRFHFLLAICLMLTARSFATMHMVNVANFQFTPASLTAQVGDTVMWMWVNGDHTTTSATIPSGAASWNSPISSTTTSFMYKLTAAGTYNYVCTPHSPNMAGTITVSSTTGIPGISADNNVKLYPNPVTNTMYLDLNKIKGTVNVLVVDAAGHTVQTATTNGGKLFTMDAAKLATGMYILQVTAGDIREAHTFNVVR